jgi:hypothetical protein
MVAIHIENPEKGSISAKMIVDKNSFMFIRYAIKPFQGFRVCAAIFPELHSGLFTLNHFVVSLDLRFEMYAGD